MLTLLVWIALIGLLCWLLIKLVPMPDPFPKIVIAVGIVLAVLLVLRAFGLWDVLDQPVPRVR
jgi:hypothetical protein